MKNENNIHTNCELVVEFYNKLENLYKITTEYRDAFKMADEEKCNFSTQNLLAEMQNIYWFYEKNRAINELSNKALLLVNQFNKYVTYFNYFAKSTDRMGAIAQENAKQAEVEFGIFVEMILSYISEIKPVALRMEEKLNEEKSNRSKQNVFDYNSQININPYIEVNPQINVTPQIDFSLDISTVINYAKGQAQNSKFDDELLKQVLDCLEEIHRIAQEALPKETRWNKVKKVLKWVTEQSIQVASIVIPTIIGMI